MKRNRIKAQVVVTKADIKPNPMNWREHPSIQLRGLASVLGKVGYVDSLLVVENKDGDERYMLIDGEARYTIATDEQELPCTVLDLTDEEQSLVLSTFDSVTYLGESNELKVQLLIEDVLKSIKQDVDGELTELLENVNFFFGEKEKLDIFEEIKTQEEDLPFRSLYVHFHNDKDVEDFKTLIGKDFGGDKVVDYR